MDRQQHNVGSEVKVTYIETQFVTSDAAGFKDLVQRLTGRSPAAAAAAAPPAPAAPPHGPRACSAGGDTGRTAAAGAAGPQGYDYRRQAAGEARCPAVASGAPPCRQEAELLLGMDYDFSDLFCVGASDQWRHGSFNGGYIDLPYY